MSRRATLLLGIAMTAGFTALWHGPLGAGERLVAQSEASARRTLDFYELPMVQAHMQRGPLARRLRSGRPALPPLRHADPPRGVHEPVELQLPALPAPPTRA